MLFPFFDKKEWDFIKMDNRNMLLFLLSFGSIYRKNDLFEKEEDY